MTATVVKICGIKEESTLRAMAGLPVDYVGFVFAPSKRQVTPERATELLAVAQAVPMAAGKAPRAVGVFVNPTLEQLSRTLSIAPLDVVQLHGDETPAFCGEVAARLGVEVWRALAVGEAADDDIGGGAQRLDDYAGKASAVLLDTAGGGTGRTFRWDAIPAYREAAARNGLKLLVAGGLSPDNVGALVADYSPDGVDVSSGVETDGTKDIGKIAAFAERVKRS